MHVYNPRAYPTAYPTPDDPRRLPLPHARRSEKCTFMINASAACNNTAPCSIRVIAKGSTEAMNDYVSLFKVPAALRGTPLSAIGDGFNLIAVFNGRFDYNDVTATATGILVGQFISDNATTDAGWRLTWEVVPSAPPSQRWCTSRSESGASGTVTDGSGKNYYGNK